MNDQAVYLIQQNVLGAWRTVGNRIYKADAERIAQAWAEESGAEHRIVEPAIDASVGALAATTVLEVARAAWREMRAAEAEMARLRRYPHHSAAMKADQVRWSTRQQEARAQLAAVLGAAA